MKQDSIQEALNIIIEALDKSNIEIVDKVELMLNIRMFLLNYEEEKKEGMLKQWKI